MEISDNLYQHEFHKKVHSNLIPCLEKFVNLEWEFDNDSDRLFRAKNPPEINWREYYHWCVFQYSANLIGAIDKLNDIQTYIGRFPSPRTYERKGITQDTWIKYHYGNYVSTMVTIYDTSLLLVNEVFLLGLDPRDCKERTVAKNSKVINTAAGNALAGLNKVTQQYRYPRNIQQHRGEQPEIGILQVHEALSNLQRAGEHFMDKNKLDELYVLARSAITADLEIRTQQVVNVLSQLFDSLIAQYDLQSKIYSLEETISGKE